MHFVSTIDTAMSMMPRRLVQGRARLAPARLVDAVLLAVLLVGLLIISIPQFSRGTWWGYDAWAYWSVNPSDPYALPMNAYGAFLYAPPIAQTMGVVAALVPWSIFLMAWTGLLYMALAWLGRGYAAFVFLFPMVFIEVLVGNIHLLLATALILGFKRPALWAFLILTKVTPVVGLAWFAGRRDWRSVAIALGTTLCVASVSFVLAPHLWVEWIDRLKASASQDPTWLGSLLPPLWLRLAGGAVAAFIAGSLGWRWPMAFILVLTLPNFSVITPAAAVAVLTLGAMDRRDPLPRVSWRGVRGTALPQDPQVTPGGVGAQPSAVASRGRAAAATTRG